LAHPLATYEIVEIAAGGSYGTVCIVRERLKGDSRVLAMKVLDLEQLHNESVLKRARDEVRILSRLDHPNLVKVEPVLQVHGRPVLIMEYVAGATLEQLIQQHPDGLAGAEVTEIIKQAARGLAAAWHTPVGPKNQPMKIVHRDVKPGNIMIADTGQVKVVDFGLAKAEFDDREANTMVFVVGSRGYMAPERSQGIDHSPACDVYSLGLTLFELATGKKLVASKRERRHDDDVKRVLEHVSPAGLNEDSRAKLQDLIQSMCSFEPEARPEMRDIPGILIEVQKSSRLKPNMGSFAKESVVPIVEARTFTAPDQHKRYSNVQFLEEAPPEGLSVNMDLNPFTESEQLSTRSNELAELIAAYPTSDVGPLLEILDKALIPRWKFWKRGPSAAVVLGAIHALSSRTDDEIMHRIERLVKHRDEGVSTAAISLLNQASK
jgi:serine/threonine protein kinase